MTGTRNGKWVDITQSKPPLPSTPVLAVSDVCHLISCELAITPNLGLLGTKILAPAGPRTHKDVLDKK